MIMNKFLINILVLLNIVGCNAKFAKKPPKTNNKMINAYTKQQDSHPASHEIPDLSLIKDLVPKYEPKSRYGNPEKYTVLNKTYRVLDSSNGYKESGYASWYGTKFHGFRTSSGEIYDMYAMTAAHKTLPLPTYAKVTNLYNNRSVIVKINDRGPFHGGRIVDLSYAAANKLGILANGVGKVEVVALTPDRNFINKIEKSKSTNNSLSQLQLGAFSVKTNAQKLASELEVLLKKYQNNYRVDIVKYSLQNHNKENILYKVIISSRDGELSIHNLKKILAKIPDQQSAFIIN